jgi:hypothetical protein
MILCNKDLIYFHQSGMFFNKVEVQFKGPIFFSAPHGVAVFRNKKSGKVIHKREHSVTRITKKLSVIFEEKLGFPISYIVWDSKSVDFDPNSLDPNYLKIEEFSKSPWNQSIKKFKSMYPYLPLLHIDLHGKKDLDDNLHIDLGLEPMKVEWKNQDEFDNFEKIFNNRMNILFEEYKDLNYGVSKKPKFKAYWKDKIHYSMSHQSILEGIRKNSTF